MSELANPAIPNGTDQNGKMWDEFDQRFWELYKTVDETKLRRNIRWFAAFSFGLVVLYVCAGLYTLLGWSSTPNIWILALFLFSFATLLIYITRRELAIWRPEKVPS